MATELRVLFVEDNEDDAVLEARCLERAGYALEWQRVEDSASMRRALDERTFDLIISDWSLPQFSGPEALAVLKDTGLDVPFIIVSGTVVEEAAVEAMLGGARDYITKGRLARLPAAVERELREHEQRIARRHAEEALIRTEKLRALGQMAAGVTHDLKNILNPLSLHVQLASRALSHGNTEDAKSCLDEMRGVLTRGVQTLERLRAFSKQVEDAPAGEVDLDRLLHESAEISRPRMSASHARRMPRIREQLGAPPHVRGHAADIVAALVNLIVNAIDALVDGGTITLSSGVEDGRVFARVSDDGPGMPPEVEQRVFEPFFTTKGEEGTGLGLAMVNACMHRHNGSVELHTAPGKGTTFTLWFPLP